ncbi:hypothetical protein [Neolewinella persica]|uniref:hypothetical protein n=1 Tax=Neolewinella persica TaxID=70998 RepID=UPI0004755211|nr:hypothetical protein [Neolewinella persica]
MKYLYQFLIISFLFLAGDLSAQQYRLRLDVGTSGVLKNDQLVTPAATLGLEMLINLSPRTFLIPEAGLQQTHIFHEEFRAADLFFIGQIPVDFFNTESYKMNQTGAFVGLGLERHLHRVRLQLFGRAVRRIAGQVTYNESINFQRGSRPENNFSVTVKPGEVFSQDMQLGTLRYSHEFTFQGGISVRYDLTEGCELGLVYSHGIGNSQLERRVISFCENCPVSPEAEPERSVAAQTNTVSVTGRYTF